MKLCLISSGQPSANPRLIKEAISLLSQGHSVRIIWCPISPWADRFDDILFEKYPNIEWIQAGFHHNRQKYLHLYARIRKKLWEIFYYIFGNLLNSAIKSSVLFSQELTEKATVFYADVYIGHNLGALPAIVKAATKNKAKSIFDFEDFHRGEALEGSIQSIMVKEIEDYYIPSVNHLTAASSAISSSYQMIFPEKKITTINNYFPLSFAVKHFQILPQKPLKLFWFSQFVGKERGVQTIIEAMSNFSQNEITLTLLGNSDEKIRNYFLAYALELGLSKSQLTFVDPVSENEIVQIASMHHIGLASEYVHIQNRDLCLTNKLFMYLLAGNALVVSDTSAQKAFLAENQGIGLLYEQQNAFDLFLVLKNYLNNPEFLLEHRKKSLFLGLNKCNWDLEKNHFLQNVQRLLVK